ncbi:MAG: hypothetical protein WA398_05750, partial [Nitrososphaeraceae archaeon]
VRIIRTGWLSWIRANDKTIIDILENQGSNLVTAKSSNVELLMRRDTIVGNLSLPLFRLNFKVHFNT